MAASRMLWAIALWETLLGTAFASEAGCNASKSVLTQLTKDPDCAGSCSLSGFGSDMQMALFPNSEGTMCKAAYGLPPGGTTIDLPGFASFGSIALDLGVSTGSRVWKGDSDDLSEVEGCSNHPGLVEGRSYCFFSMVTKQAEPQTLKGFYSGSSPLHWNRQGDGRRLQDSPIELPDSICVAVNAAERLVSVSMDPGVGASVGPYKIELNGASFSTAGCSQVPLMEYLDFGNKRRTGHMFPTQMNVAATLELGLKIQNALELTVTVQAVVGMNLDLGGKGSMADPSSVLNAMLTMDGKHVAPNWGVVMRASIDVHMKLGTLELNPGSVEGQIFWTQTGWDWPVFHLTFSL